MTLEEFKQRLEGIPPDATLYIEDSGREVTCFGIDSWQGDKSDRVEYSVKLY